MKKLFRKIAQPILAPIIFKVLNKKSQFKFEDIEITIFPGVFHPKYFYSTKVLLRYLKNINLSGKTLLELGAGSGIISFYASKKGAKVTATDISVNVIEGLTENKNKLDAGIEIIHSYLFESIPQTTFDYLLVNPPYFPKAPETEKDLAWFCGANFEYFENFFSSLKPFVNDSSNVIMVLSEDCNLDAIRAIAQNHDWGLHEVDKVKGKTETNYLYEIS
jgi:release factor glutamine methyltransferase